MPTSLPISASRARSARAARRLLLGWSWSDWGLFLAAYGIILCAVIFAAPDQRPSVQPAPQAAMDLR